MFGDRHQTHKQGRRESRVAERYQAGRHDWAMRKTQVLLWG